jgi:hypothetical protein
VVQGGRQGRRRVSLLYLGLVRGGGGGRLMVQLAQFSFAVRPN